MPLNLEMVDEMVAYLHERERVRIKKEAGEPRPWTENKALNQFSFTNVLRANDYTSRWLMDHWYTPNGNQSSQILLLNCGIARYFGRVEFLEKIGFSHEWDPERIREAAEESMDAGEKVFTSAYVITNGGVSDYKYNVVVDHYLSPFAKRLDRLIEIAEKEQRWQPIAEYMMRNLPGMGGSGFMTKEILSDFILATKGRYDWQDLYTWSPVGPGAQKGLAWLYDRQVGTKVNTAQALKELREVAEAVAARLEPWMPQFGAELDLHGIQFACCEFQKLCRVVHLGERMKNNYRPRK